MAEAVRKGIRLLDDTLQKAKEKAKSIVEEAKSNVETQTEPLIQILKIAYRETQKNLSEDARIALYAYPHLHSNKIEITKGGIILSDEEGYQGTISTDMYLELMIGRTRELKEQKRIESILPIVKILFNDLVEVQREAGLIPSEDEYVSSRVNKLADARGILGTDAKKLAETFREEYNALYGKIY